MNTLNLKKLLIKFLQTPMIVESGTSGIWTYRKWSDGTAECWGVASGTTATIYGQNAGQYGVDYPFTFTVTPVPTVSVWVSGDAFSYACWVSTSTTRIEGYLRAPSTTAGVAFSAHLHIIGKWK